MLLKIEEEITTDTVDKVISLYNRLVAVKIKQTSNFRAKTEKIRVDRSSKGRKQGYFE